MKSVATTVSYQSKRFNRDKTDQSTPCLCMACERVYSDKEQGLDK